MAHARSPFKVWPRYSMERTPSPASIRDTPSFPSLITKVTSVRVTNHDHVRGENAPNCLNFSCL